MTREQAVEAFLAGKPVMIVEYRAMTTEVIKWTDKKTGKRREGPMIKHGVEAGDSAIQVSEFIEMAEGEKPEDAIKRAKPVAAKGQKCLLVFDSFERVMGSLRAQGTLEPLQAAPASR